jgi:hypothetical protein
MKIYIWVCEMVERYGLKFNPFPRTEAEQYRNEPEKLEVVLFDYERNKLEEYARIIQNATVSFAVIGPWGTGKTLFLLYLYKLLRQLYGVNKVKLVYIKAPSDNEDLVKKLCNELGISTTSKKLADLLEVVRQRIKELVNSGYIVYIALDQLEETYRNITEDEKKVHEFVEIVRGKLSAMVEKSYVLGISIIEPVWGAIIARWPSMTGIESIKLRTLEPEETEIFIARYLERARDQELIRMYGLEKEIKDNPTYPFTEDAVAEIYRLSGGVQRNICAWAYESLEKSKDKFDRIDSFIVRLVIDRKLYLRQRSMEEILPYHPMRIPMVIKEILSYIWNKYGSKYNVIWIGPIDRNILFINLAGKNTILYMVTKQTLTAEDLTPIEKYLQEGVAINNEKYKVDVAIVLHFVSQSSPYSKLVEPGASVIFMKIGDKLKRKVVFRDSVNEWGRLAAYYLYVRNELPFYIMSEDDENAEIKAILKILGLA